MEPLLNVENVVGGYSNKNVLKDISFSVNRGEIVALIGLNGAGKSTAIKHIIGLMEQKSGKITVDGLTLTDDLTEYRKKIGYIRSEERRVGKERRLVWERA